MRLRDEEVAHPAHPFFSSVRVDVEPAHADARRPVAGTAQCIVQHADSLGDALKLGAKVLGSDGASLTADQLDAIADVHWDRSATHFDDPVLVARPIVGQAGDATRQLRDLLEPPANRPATFYRGYDVLDPVRVGFISDVPEENGRRFTFYDTKEPTKSNRGHLYGVGLPDADKDAIVEYLKTF